MFLLRLITGIVVGVLIWLEVIPVKKWLYQARIRLVGAATRNAIEVVDKLDKLSRLLE